MAKRPAPKYQPEDRWETKARRFDDGVEARLLRLEGYIVKRWPKLARRLGIGQADEGDSAR